MVIVIYKAKEFEGHKIIVRRIGTFFESVVMIAGELYSNHQIVKPRVYERVLYWLRVRKDIYTSEQILYIQKYLEQLAIGTIKGILKPKGEVLR